MPCGVRARCTSAALLYSFKAVAAQVMTHEILSHTGETSISLETKQHTPEPAHRPSPPPFTPCVRPPPDLSLAAAHSTTPCTNLVASFAASFSSRPGASTRCSRSDRLTEERAPSPPIRDLVVAEALRQDAVGQTGYATEGERRIAEAVCLPVRRAFRRSCALSGSLPDLRTWAVGKGQISERTGASHAGQGRAAGSARAFVIQASTDSLC